MTTLATCRQWSEGSIDAIRQLFQSGVAHTKTAVQALKLPVFLFV